MITIIENKSEYINENIEELTRIVFDVCGLEGEIIIDDWDLDRIYITKEGREWIIRTWSAQENNKGRVVIDWTLYRMKPDGSSAEGSMGSGKTVMKNKKE
jgi:hypothetical protein